MITSINEFRKLFENKLPDFIDQAARNVAYSMPNHTIPINGVYTDEQIENAINKYNQLLKQHLKQGLVNKKLLFNRIKEICNENRVNEENAVQQQVTDTTLNSDKTTQLTGYENDMGYYNSNKNKLLLLSQKAADEKTEQEANKIINGNIYLGMAWKLYKMQTAMKADEEKLGSNQISSEEKSQIQTNINTNKTELAKVKKELDDKIRNDLGQIKKL